MARTLTPVDAHALMNALVKQATGQQQITAVDTSSFVSAGELVLSTGVENTLNALSLIIGRTFMAVRPYEAKLRIIDAINTGAYTDRMRKISFYSKDAQAAGDFNTNLYTNLYEGVGDIDYNSGGIQNVGSMWEQNKPVPLEVNFAGSGVWDDSLTVYEYQLKKAFRDESEFNAFVSGIMTQKENDIELQKEAWNRMVLLNQIAGRMDVEGSLINGGAVNLTTAFNTRFGTSYTSAQLRTTYLTDFLAFLVSTIKQYSRKLEIPTINHHYTPSLTRDGVTYTSLLRHTPRSKQKLVMYEPLFIDATAQVLPEIFNPEYLDIGNYEGVMYWQAEGVGVDNAGINVTPAIPDGSGSQTASSDPVVAEYIVGFLFDEDAVMTNFMLEEAYSTPLNARHSYRNLWWHFCKGAINDFTENGIVFYMAD